MVALPGVGLHLALVGRASSELRLLALVVLLGFLVDSGLAATRLVRFEAPAFGPMLAPPWILALWLLLATTLRHSLGWLRGRYLPAAVLGGVSGPLSYAAGERLGAVQFPPERWPSLGALAAVWALVLPLLLTLARPQQGQA
jgi:hypothetical protein